MDKTRYPSDWAHISYRLRSERAGWKCEWCGAAKGDKLAQPGRSVYLSVAHLGVKKPDGSPGDKHDKMDVRDENLAVLCQRCHLNFDRADHLAVQRKRRQQRRYPPEAIQLELRWD